MGAWMQVRTSEITTVWNARRRTEAFMPERSKGFDSSSNVFVLVGSNPTQCNVINKLVGEKSTGKFFPL